MLQRNALDKSCTIAIMVQIKNIHPRMKYEKEQIGKKKNLKNMQREKRGNHADNSYNNVNIVVVDMGLLLHKETDENILM